MRYFPLFLLSLGVHAFFAHAQAACTFRLSGRVTDHRTGQPLAFAHVVLAGTDRGTYSDEQGRFQFGRLCPGQYTIQATHVACAPVQHNFYLRQDTALTLVLDHQVTALSEVVVASAAPVAPDEMVLRGRELLQTRGQSLGEALLRLPGVRALQTGPTIFQPIVHGLYGNRLAIVHGGLRLESQRWGVEHAPELDPFVAQELRVVKGAAALRYGPEAVGGAVIVDPPTLPRRAGLAGEMTLVGMQNNLSGHASGRLEGGVSGWEGFGWRVQATGRRGGDARAADYVLSNTGLREGNLSLATGYRAERIGAELYYSRFQTTLGILRAAHIGSRTDLENAIGRQVPQYTAPFSYEINNPRQRVVHDLLRTRLHWSPREAGQVTLLVAQQFNQRKEFDIRRGGRSDRPALLMELGTQTAELHWELPAQEHWTHTFGATASLQRNRNRTGETGVRPLVPDHRTQQVGAFWSQAYSRDRWTLTGGLRHDWRQQEVLVFTNRRGSFREDSLLRPQYRTQGLSASAGATYRLSASARWHAQLSRTARLPMINETFSQGLHHGAAAIEEGVNTYSAVGTPFSVRTDTTFGNEVGYQMLQTLTYETGRWHLEASGYVHYFQNYINLEPQGELRQTIRGAFPTFQYRQTDARLLGADLQTRYALSERLMANGQAAWVRGRDQRRDDFLIWVPADRYTADLTYQLPRWGRLRQLYATAGAHYVDRQRRSPGAPGDFAPPPAAYALAFARVGAAWPMGRYHCRLNLSAENIFNHAYREYLNRLRYFADDVGRDLILQFHFSF